MSIRDKVGDRSLQERLLYNGYCIEEFFVGTFDVYPKGSDTLMYSAETIEEAKSMIDYWNAVDRRI